MMIICHCSFLYSLVKWADESLLERIDEAGGVKHRTQPHPGHFSAKDIKENEDFSLFKMSHLTF